MPPAVIRVLPLDGVWETIGQGRLAGVVHEGLHYAHDGWGSTTCSFSLRRDPRVQHPDLGAWTPCEIEKLGVQAWIGRVLETPTQEGADEVMNVSGLGMQYHLDDDMAERKYVHANLTDWVDRRSVPGVALGTNAYTANADVQVGEGAITLAFANANTIGAGDRASVVFDAGPENLIERAVWHFTTSNNNNVSPQAQVFCSGYNGLDGFGSGATVCGWNGSALTTVGAGPAYSSGTLSTPCRYLSFILFWAAGGTVTNDAWVSLDQITLFTSSAYESGNASVLRPKDVIKDAVQLCPLLAQVGGVGTSQVLDAQRFAGNGADDTTVGTAAWATPTTITASDVAYAHAGAFTSPTSGTTHYLKSSSHGFAIPATATIVGIKAEFQRSFSISQSPNQGNEVTDNSIKLVKGGVISGNDKSASAVWYSNYPNEPSGANMPWASFGGSSDLWGVALTPTDVNASGFGVVISANWSANFFSEQVNIWINAVRITVFYTVPTPGTDTSQIDPDGLDAFALDDFAPEGERTPRELWSAADAYNAWKSKIDEQYRPVYAPLPASPSLVIGEWSGADFNDSSANSGAEVYNKAVAEATGPDGSPVRIARLTGQQDTTTLRASSSPIPDNPGFEANTTSWTVDAGTLTRTTVAGEFDSGVAGGKWDATAAGTNITETFTGTFKKGVTYVLTLRMRTNTDTGNVTNILFGMSDGSDTYSTYLSRIYSAGFQTFTLVWTPKADQTGAVLKFSKLSQLKIFYIDSLQLSTSRPTIVDKRGFTRATTLPLQAAVSVAGGTRITDIYLSQHRSTPSKGSAIATYGGVRSMADGHPVHPGLLGMYTTELVRLAHRTDPDTGGLGRDVRLVAVDADDQTESASLSFDNTRTNFEALLARYALIEATHRSAG